MTLRYQSHLPSWSSLEPASQLDVSGLGQSLQGRLAPLSCQRQNSPIQKYHSAGEVLEDWRDMRHGFSSQDGE